MSTSINNDLQKSLRERFEFLLTEEDPKDLQITLQQAAALLREEARDNEDMGLSVRAEEDRRRASQLNTLAGIAPVQETTKGKLI